MNDGVKRLYTMLLSKRSKYSYKVAEKTPRPVMILMTDTDGNSEKIRYLDVKIEESWSFEGAPNRRQFTWVSLGDHSES